MKTVFQQIVVTDMVFEETERFVQKHGQKRTFVYFRGSAVINGTELPFNLHLVSDDGSIPKAKGTYSARIEFNPNRGDGIEECNQCSGNWGRSDPETPGLTAVAVGKVLKPLLNAGGFKMYDPLGVKGGIHLTMRAPLISEKQVNGRRFYCTVVQTIDCPVCGRVKQRVSEFNA